MIIAFCGEKGGPGKTTVAINMATMRTKSSHDVLIIDTDEGQTSASEWCTQRDDSGVIPRIPSVQKFGKSLKREALELSNKYEDIIIDAGGRDSPELRGSL